MTNSAPYKRLKISVLLLLFFSTITVAQNQTYTVTDSIETAFLPALSYNSDFGFMTGGLAHRFHYKRDNHPFFSFTQMAAIVSTKGLASGFIEHDKPNVFETNMRLISSVYVSRFFQNPYYGIGTYGTIEDSFNSSQDLYTFKSFSFGFSSNLRVPMYSRNSSSFDALFLIDFDYETPWDNDASSLITQEAPLGENGGRTLHFGTGFIWENRNSEFRPTKGNYISSSIEAGQKWLGSSYNTFIFRADARQYISFNLIREITWANRIFAKNTSGDVPYWELAFAGDEETLRGYPSRRFLDDNALIWNSELRTWLFGIDAIKSEFGGVLFFDAGRTYSNGSSLETILDDLKISGGVGSTMSLFTPDFILRTDVGFSEEGVGVYFTAGYMF